MNESKLRIKAAYELLMEDQEINGEYSKEAIDNLVLAVKGYVTKW